MVIDSRVHRVKGNINKITGDDVYIGNRLGQKKLYPVKTAVNVRYIYYSHSYLCNLQDEL